MRWLLDGYNVIRRDPDLKAREAESLAAGRSALVHLVARVARDSPDEFVVVFDGARPGVAAGGAPSGRVQVMFSRPPRTADDVLRDLAVRWREAAIVVTSDRTVQDAARRAGAVVVPVERFLERLDAPPEAGGGDDELDEEDADGPGRPKRGNPRRLSREARATERALRRLR